MRGLKPYILNVIVFCVIVCMYLFLLFSFKWLADPISYLLIKTTIKLINHLIFLIFVLHPFQYQSNKYNFILL